MGLMPASNTKVSKKWSRRKPSPEDCNFNMSPVFSRHKINAAFGEEFVEEFCDSPFFAEDIFVRKFLTKRSIRRVLSLCCGFGRIEQRIVAQLESVESCTGVDVAEGALEVASKTAREQGLNNIDYICADLNSWTWEEGSYDLVIAYGALHHLENLDTVLDGIKKCLRPGGLLFSHEYVGLPYYECTPRQLQLANAMAYLVPPELRMRKGSMIKRPKMLFRMLSSVRNIGSGYYDRSWPVWKKMVVKLAGKFLRGPDNSDFGMVTLSPHDIIKKSDPSEGVSAPFVIPGLQKRFGSLETMYSGGALLEYALDNQFYANFNYDDPRHIRTADMLWNLEQFYTGVHEIGPHNVYLVAEK